MGSLFINQLSLNVEKIPIYDSIYFQAIFKSFGEW